MTHNILAEINYHADVVGLKLDEGSQIIDKDRLHRIISAAMSNGANATLTFLLSAIADTMEEKKRMLTQDEIVDMIETFGEQLFEEVTEKLKKRSKEQ